MDFLAKHKIFSAVMGLLVLAIILAYVIPLPQAKYNTGKDIPDMYGEFIQLNDYFTYIEQYNKTSSKSITFIHGFGGSTYSWKDNAIYFSNLGYHVVLLDLKGFGLSEKKFDTDYSHKAQAKLVKDILDKLNISTTTIVGHSMGGNVALYFDQTYPERVDKLVIVDGAIVETKSFNPGSLLGLPILNRAASDIFAYTQNRDFVKNFLNNTYKVKEALTDDVIDEYYKPLQIKNWQDSLVGIVRDSGNNTLPKPLTDIKTPTLIIWGELDPAVPLKNGYELNLKIKDSTLQIISGAGHLPMAESPGQFNQLLGNFLKI